MLFSASQLLQATYEIMAHPCFSKTNAPPLIIRLLTTTSWHPPPVFGSCRRGRRLPAADVGRHQFAFCGQACCPWSAASPSHSRCLGKCSAEETWVKNEELSHPAGDGESDSRVYYVSPRFYFSPLVSQLALFSLSWSLIFKTIKVNFHR